MHSHVRKNMLETSENYVLVKHFRRENVDNTANLQSLPGGASTSQGIRETNKPVGVPKKSRSTSGKFSRQRTQETKITFNQPKLKAEDPLMQRIIYWLRVLLYYILFYAGLISLFSGCMLAFIQTLPKDMPRVSKYQPSLIYFPILEPYYVNRIFWKEGNKGDLKALVKSINSLLDQFGKKREYGACNEIDYYGYGSRSPCVFLKVNRIANFKVEPIDNSKDLPLRERSLKQLVDELPESARKKRLWISCIVLPGETAREYFPSHRSISIEGINTNQKSDQRYLNQSDYERFVTIKLNKIPINIPINVTCRMFAKNIEISYDGKRSGIGGVKFSIKLIVP